MLFYSAMARRDGRAPTQVSPTAGVSRSWTQAGFDGSIPNTVPLGQVAAAAVDAAVLLHATQRAGQHDGMATLPAYSA
jgi:hypothetical protein